MMSSLKQFGLGRRPAATAAALAGLVLAIVSFSGCAKKNRMVDPGLTMPVGTLSSDARVTVWYDAEVTAEYYSPGNPPTLIGTETVRIGDPGSIHGVIIDRTSATEYQVLRRESGGGFRGFQDFTLHPKLKWLATQWEMYQFTDPAPSSFTPSTYVGRGLLNGTVTDASPLTNVAEISPLTIAPITVTIDCDYRAGVDSVDILLWTPVTGAVGYWVHMYEPTQLFAAEKIREGLLSPIFIPDLGGRIKTDLVLFVTGDTRYRLGDTTRADVDILYQRALLPQPDPSYTSPHIRVTAVDANGQIIGFTFGSTQDLRLSDDEFVRFRTGALAMETEGVTARVRSACLQIVAGEILNSNKLRAPRPR